MAHHFLQTRTSLPSVLLAGPGWSASASAFARHLSPQWLGDSSESVRAELQTGSFQLLQVRTTPPNQFLSDVSSSSLYPREQGGLFTALQGLPTAWGELGSAVLRLKEVLSTRLPQAPVPLFYPWVLTSKWTDTIEEICIFFFLFMFPLWPHTPYHHLSKSFFSFHTYLKSLASVKTQHGILLIPQT